MKRTSGVDDDTSGASVGDPVVAGTEGADMLDALEDAPRFNLWMGDQLRPYVGQRVLEIGSGIGNLTSQLVPRASYVASDIEPSYLRALERFTKTDPNIEIRRVDAAEPNDFETLRGRFDTALMINVLEHVPDPIQTLGLLHQSLEAGGRAVILVPQHPKLYGTLDRVLEHQLRYTRPVLEQQLRDTGFIVERIFDFNRISVPGWWLSGKVLRRTTLSRAQLKVLEMLMPVIRRIDRLWPWSGLSLIAVGLKPDR